MGTGDSEHDKPEIRGLIYYYPELGMAHSYIFVIIELIVGLSGFALGLIMYSNFFDRVIWVIFCLV